MSTRIGAGFHPRKMQSKTIKRHIAHFSHEPGRPCDPRLLESDLAAESSLNRKILAPIDGVDYKLLAVMIYLLPDMPRYASVRAAIENRGAIIRIEKGDAETGNRKGSRFAAARWTSHNSHSRLHQPPTSRSASSRMSGGKSRRIRWPCWSMIPLSCSSRTAVFTRSTAAGKYGSSVGAWLIFGISMVATISF
jgi:hypothetical protein